MSRGVTSRAGIPLQSFHNLPSGGCRREEGDSPRRVADREERSGTPAGTMFRHRGEARAGAESQAGSPL